MLRREAWAAAGAGAGAALIMGATAGKRVMVPRTREEAEQDDAYVRDALQQIDAAKWVERWDRRSGEAYFVHRETGEQ